MPVRSRHQRSATDRQLDADDSHPAPDKPSSTPAPSSLTWTSAAWVGVCVGAFVLIALVVFMLQNTAAVEVTFLGLVGTAPLAVVLLIAGLSVGLVALVAGGLRIGQLRRRLRAERHSQPGVRPAVSGGRAS